MQLHRSSIRLQFVAAARRRFAAALKALCASCLVWQASQAFALPPPGAALAQNTLPNGRWVDHMVIPGERLTEIAARYGVTVASLIEWNGLDADKPSLRIGQKLKVHALLPAQPRRRQRYKVKEGDSWSKIAKAYDVDADKLQRVWNPTVEGLQPGDHVIIWVESDQVAPTASAPAATSATKSVAATTTTATTTKTAPVVAPVVSPSSTSGGPNADFFAAVAPSTSAAAARVPGAARVPTATVSPANAITTTSVRTLAASSSTMQSKSQATATTSTSSPQVLPTSRDGRVPFPAKTMVQPTTAKATTTTTKPMSTTTTSAKPVPSAPRPTVGLPAVPTKLSVPFQPIMPAGEEGHSVGSPTRGRLRNGKQMPFNDRLYSLRNPDHSWGSSLTVEQLQRAIAAWRQQTNFPRELVIADMSLKNGGRFRPHRSHTSGRDVDIRLPLREGVAAGTLPESVSVVDWDATWQLVKALMATSKVQYIFLARSRQAPLYRAAQRAGENEDSLARFMQYPGFAAKAVLRHSAGHTKHMHVRFVCSPTEDKCHER